MLGLMKNKYQEESNNVLGGKGNESFRKRSNRDFRNHR